MTTQTSQRVALWVPIVALVAVVLAGWLWQV